MELSRLNVDFHELLTMWAYY